MGSQGRKAWDEFFKSALGAPDVDHIISDWEKFVAAATKWDDVKYGRYLFQYYPELKKSAPEQAMWLVMLVHQLKIDEPQTIAGPKRGIVPGLDQLIAKKGEAKIFMHPVTAYSGTNPEELFAETFSHIVLYGPGRIPEIVRETFKRAVPQLRTSSLVGKVADTFIVNTGEHILFGKYKNKKGIIRSIGKDPKGNPIIEVEPVPKGRKQNKIIQLFRVWKDPAATVEKVTSRYLSQNIKNTIKKAQLG
jgi:hypothetical protein